MQPLYSSNGIGIEGPSTKMLKRAIYEELSELEGEEIGVVVLMMDRRAHNENTMECVYWNQMTDARLCRLLAEW